MKRPDTPFPRHWLYYISLKLVVVVLAIMLTAFIFFQLFRV